MKEVRKVFADDNDFWKNVERPILQDAFGVSPGSVFLSFLAVSEYVLCLDLMDILECGEQGFVFQAKFAHE